MPVRPAVIGLEYDGAELDLGEVQLKEATLRWGAAVGLALWGTGNDPALSLVPAEVKERQQYQRALAASAGGLAVVALLLGGVSLARDHAAATVADEVTAENAQAASLQSTIIKIQPSAGIHGQLLTERGLAVQALSGDIDWVGLLHRIDTALPQGVTIDSISVSRTIAPTAGGAPATSTGSASVSTENSDIGQISMSLTTTGGAPSVADFVRQMWDVQGVSALWVSSTTSGQSARSAMQFTATANITEKALSDRAAGLPGANLPGVQP